MRGASTGGAHLVHGVTDDLKRALPDRITETVALTVSSELDNAYERHQHERLCLKLGWDPSWIRAVEARDLRREPPLSETERRVQALTLAILRQHGKNTTGELQALVEAIGHVQAVAVLMLIGRYVTHAADGQCARSHAAGAVTTDVTFSQHRGHWKLGDHKGHQGTRRPKTTLMPEPALWVTESDVVSLMDMPAAIRALEAGLRAEARGAAINMTKTHVSWPAGDASPGQAGVEGTLHAIGAAFPDAGFVGTKTWAHTPQGATPLVILYDSGTGTLRAVIEAFAMGQLRTGAASGLATRLLSAEDAVELAIIGTGKQALTQVAAVHAVRPLERVRVFGRDAGRRRRFSERVRKDLGLDVVEAESVEEAVRGAPIVTAVTRARDPFLFAPMVARRRPHHAVAPSCRPAPKWPATCSPAARKSSRDSPEQAAGSRGN